MTKNKTRAALVSSVISLILCFSMLLGTTFAWFTDEVSNTGNIIASGTLDISLSYSEDGKNWKDASEGAIFDYKHWEPGYVDVKAVKIANNGNLALKYTMSLDSDEVANDKGYKLSDVIDVYMSKSPITSRSQVANMTPVGTLAELMADADGAARGIMLPAEDVKAPSVTLPAGAVAETGESVYYIALKMQESAGNEYQNLSVGTGIAVKLLATQYTYENDSFDNQYDGASHLPAADVKYAPQYVGVTGLEWNEQYSPVKDANVSLDTAYVFKTTETYAEAQKSEYRYWHADFAVSFDRDVTASDVIGLAGNYGSYKWIGFKTDADTIEFLEEKGFAENGVIPAGTEIRLLALMETPMNYEELCLWVQEFKCGAWAESLTADLTMNVELRLYETTADPESESGSKNIETGKSEVIGAYSYTFRAETPSDLPVAIVADANEYENTAIEWNKQFDIYPPDGTQLESVYTFTAQDDYEAAQESNYADWICDYYVSLDTALEDNQLVLGGNYGSYGWIGFVAPGGIDANKATPLLQSANMTFTYADICLTVQEFTCGVADINDALSGQTITVDLRITNPNNAAEYYVIESVSYTFQ